MAERRMLSKKITDTDAFIKMSSAAQALYFHLNQGADDDGFNDQVTLAMMKAHAAADDLKILIAKGYVVEFESGVIVIRHWRIHNLIRQDRYKETVHIKERSMLSLDHGVYIEKTYEFEQSSEPPVGLVNQMATNCQPMVAIGEDRIGKDNSINHSAPAGARESNEDDTVEEEVLTALDVALDEDMTEEERQGLEAHLRERVKRKYIEYDPNHGRWEYGSKAKVLMSDEQFGSLCEMLSLEELDHYLSVIADCEAKGKRYRKKTHYQAVLDMVKKDRRVKKDGETND